MRWSAISTTRICFSKISCGISDQWSSENRKWSESASGACLYEQETLEDSLGGLIPLRMHLTDKSKHLHNFSYNNDFRALIPLDGPQSPLEPSSFLSRWMGISVIFDTWTPSLSWIMLWDSSGDLVTSHFKLTLKRTIWNSISIRANQEKAKLSMTLSVSHHWIIASKTFILLWGTTSNILWSEFLWYKIGWETWTHQASGAGCKHY